MYLIELFKRFSARPSGSFRRPFLVMAIACATLSGLGARAESYPHFPEWRWKLAPEADNGGGLLGNVTFSFQNAGFPASLSDIPGWVMAIYQADPPSPAPRFLRFLLPYMNVGGVGPGNVLHTPRYTRVIMAYDPATREYAYGTGNHIRWGWFGGTRLRTIPENGCVVTNVVFVDRRGIETDLGSLQTRQSIDPSNPDFVNRDVELPEEARPRNINDPGYRIRATATYYDGSRGHQCPTP